MKAEPYFKRIKKENRELKRYIRLINDWRDALDRANTTGRKSEAFAVVEEIRRKMEEQYKIIEPTLAEGEEDE